MVYVGNNNFFTEWSFEKGIMRARGRLERQLESGRRITPTFTLCMAAIAIVYRVRDQTDYRLSAVPGDIDHLHELRQKRTCFKLVQLADTL